MVKAHTQNEMPRVDELYKGGVDWKRIKKYGLPVVVTGGAAAVFFTAKSFLNDYKEEGEEVMKNLNAPAAITETTQDMEKRGVGLSVYENEGWVRIDKDYKPKKIIEHVVKNATDEDIYPVFVKNYGRDAELLNKLRWYNFGKLTEEEVNKYWKDWMIADLKYTDKEGREIYRTWLILKRKDGYWGVADSGGIIK